MAERIEFRCPHCRRAYSLELDAAKLARLDRIAVCGRCRKPFSLAKRVREATDEPPTAEPQVSERDLRDAILKKREVERVQREERAWQALVRARDSSGSPAREPALEAMRETERSASPTSSPVRLRRPATHPHPDAAPPSSPGKRRWGSVSTRREARTPAPVPVRQPARDAEGPTRTLHPRQPAPRAKSERPTPTPRERQPAPNDAGREEPATASPNSAPKDVFARARQRERREAQLEATQRPVPKPIEPGPAREQDSPQPGKSPRRRRVTAPRLGALGSAESPSSVTSVAISAPSPRRAPTPPPSRHDEGLALVLEPPPIEEPAVESAAPATARSSPPESAAPDTAPPPQRESAAPATARSSAPESAAPDTARSSPPESAASATAPSSPPEGSFDDFDELSFEDDEDDEFDEDGGDRPTLLLPDEGMLKGLVAGFEAQPSAAPGEPRNVTARVVMSRKDWIHAADPGLASLTRKAAPDVAALVALLDLAPFGKRPER